MKQLLFSLVVFLSFLCCNAQQSSLVLTNNTGTTTISCFTPAIDMAASMNPATVSVTYTWVSVNANYSGPSVTITSAGIYTVTAFDPASSFSVSQTFTITQSGNMFAPVVTIPSSNPVISCTTPSVALSGFGTSGIPPSSGFPNILPVVCTLWSGPSPQVALNGSCSYTALVPGVYSLTVTDQNNGCSSTGVKIVGDNRIYPAISAPPAFNINCPTPTVLISPNITGPASGFTYSWTAPSGATLSAPNSPATVVNAPGTYTIAVTHPFSSCTSTAGIIVAVCAPSFSILTNSGTSSVTCAQPTVSLTGSTSNYTAGTLSYNWVSSTTTLTGASVGITHPGTYTVTAYDAPNSFSLVQIYTVGSNTTTPVISAPPFISCLSITLSISPQFTFTNPSVSFLWQTPSSATVSPATTATIVVNQIGVYTVTATDTGNGCSSTTQIVVPSCVGLEENNADIFRAFPNPASGILTLHLENTTHSVFEIYNLSGDVIKKDHISPENNRIDISDLPAGVYSLRLIQNGNSSGFIKLIKLSSN